MKHQDKRAPFPRGSGDDNKTPKLATARWYDSLPIWKSGMVWLGRDACGAPIGVDDDRHLFTAASNRSGKGTGLIIPNLALWSGSAVVIDPKGENAAITAHHRAAMEGHEVIAIDPFGESGLGHEFIGTLNPLDLIDIESDEAIDAAGLLADALIVKTSAKDAHWDESSRDVIAALILHVCDTEEGEGRTLGRVRQLLTKGDPEFAEALDFIADDEEGPKRPTNAFDGLWGQMKASEATNEFVRDVIIGTAETVTAMGQNERGSVLSTARRNMRFLATPKIAQSLSKTSFDIDRLKTSKGGQTIYLCLPARMFPTHSRLLRLSVSKILYRMEEIGLDKPANGHPVLFILDEFASLGHMDMLEKAAGLMAGYGVKLWPIVQDLTQIKKHYRESWETFLANAGAMTFFANSDLTTLEWLSKRMGETEVIRENKGSSTSETKGTSETNGTSQQEGESWTESQSQTESDMAPLSQLATVQGGHSIFDVFTRRFEKSTAQSNQTGQSKGASSQNSESHSTAESASMTNGRSRSEQIIKTNLMTVDEIAAHFARETGRMIAFVSGKGPYAINRTPYFSDEAFQELADRD
ncbi:MAG: type IV secretory system conjugative DNA transfer family protein [Pseudomonadota bacterium]